jgi:hypothetical protein
MDRERYYQCTATVVKTWLSTLNIGCPVIRVYKGLDEPTDVRRRPELLDDARAAARELLGS